MPIEGRSNHDLPYGHVMSEQSAPVHPFSQSHRYVGGPWHTPLPEHEISPGQSVMSDAYPQSPRWPGWFAPSLVS